MIGTSVSEYALNKIMLRVEARILIKEIESKEQPYAVGSALSNALSLTKASICPRDQYEVDGIFDEREDSRDCKSMRNLGLSMSESEDSGVDKHKSYKPSNGEGNKFTIKVDRIDTHEKLRKMASVRTVHRKKVIKTFSVAHDWRVDDEPVAGRVDSFLSQYVPVKKELVLDFSYINDKQTLHPEMKSIKPK
jgi:hypothetical protein